MCLMTDRNFLNQLSPFQTLDLVKQAKVAQILASDDGGKQRPKGTESSPRRPSKS